MLPPKTSCTCTYLVPSRYVHMTAKDLMAG